MRFDEILMQARANKGHPNESPWVRVSGGGDAAAAVREALEKGLRESGVEARVFRASSFGYRDLEPLLTVFRPGSPAVLYGRVDPAEACDLVTDFIKDDKARPARALCATGEDGLDSIPRADDLPLFRLQSRVVLRNCGLIDPEDIDEYVACAGGYAGLSKALQTDTAAAVKIIRDSEADNGEPCTVADGIEVLAVAGGDEKYLVCNGVDGDPRSPVSALLVEGDPHAVLEGMLIAGSATGAGRLIVCVNAARPEMATRVEKALKEMEGKGLVGNNVLDSPFSCSVEIRQVQPSLVAEEETALLRFLEGKQAMPVKRPEGGDSRLFGKPGMVLFPETLSRVSAVFQRSVDGGIQGDAGIGTRVVALSGDVARPCVVEVPGGTTVGALVEEIGGGVASGRSIKAIGIGSPMGKLLGPAGMDLTIGSEAIGRASADGSMTVEVFDNGRCSVELAQERMALLRDETCGKCVFCREGILQMADILDSVVTGEGTKDDLELLGTLGKAMETGSICLVGKTAAAPVLGGLDLFRHEYEAHVKDKRCPLLKEK